MKASMTKFEKSNAYIKIAGSDCKVDRLKEHWKNEKTILNCRTSE